jgi:uncharacterized protein (TIGR03435 family)
MTPMIAHLQRMSCRLLLVAVAMLLCASIARAQIAHEGPAKAIALAATLQPYDVVSIKENKSGDQSGYVNIDDRGIFTVKNMPLESIIEFAYDVKEDQISGLVGQVSSAKFDVIAKVLPSGNAVPVELPDQNLQAMVILMLSDRFHLNAHLQPKVIPVYELDVAHGGLKIKLSQDEIHDSTWNIYGESASKILSCKGCRMADLANVLSDLAGRKVIDKTDLNGHADITLKWSDDVATQQGGADVISIFTAVEEQLGLKLQPAKGPVDNLVIDHAEMPSAN